MPGPKSPTPTKPRVAVPSSPALTGLEGPPPDPADDATFRELSLEEMTPPGESPEEVVARQAREAYHQSFAMQREEFTAYWAPRLGMTRVEFERRSREDPALLQEQMRQAWQQEEDLRDSGQAADQQDALGYERLAATSMFDAYKAGTLEGPTRTAQLARALLPRGLMGRFTPMLDKPRADGFYTGWSFIHNAAVPKKRAEGRRFFTEVDPRTIRFLPEPTVPCTLTNGFGEPCEKWLYTDEQLDTHQKYKHNQAWAQANERRAEAKAATVAEAQIEAAKAQRETAEEMRRLVAAMRQPQPTPSVEPEDPVRAEEG